MQTHDLSAPRAVPRLVEALGRRLLEAGLPEDAWKWRGVRLEGFEAEVWEEED